MRWPVIAAAVVTWACAGDSSGDDDDTESEDGAPEEGTCAEACLLGWWTEPFGDTCDTYCQFDLPGCEWEDCEQLTAHYLEEPGHHTRRQLIHSPSRRMFTLWGGAPEGTWEVPEPCILVLRGVTVVESEFSCSDEVVQRDRVVWSRASDAFAQALDEAPPSENEPVQGSY